MAKRRTPATYLTKLTVQNAKSFKDRQELNLADSKGRPSRWTLILGENGVGKTTLLQCIAATIPRRNIEEVRGSRTRIFLEAAGVIDDSVLEQLVRDSKSDFEIQATYAKNSSLSEATAKPKPKTFHVGMRLLPSRKGDPFELITAEEPNVVEPLVLIYGAGRKAGAASPEEEPTDRLSEVQFIDERELVNAEELIQQLDYAAEKRRTSKVARHQRETFLRMLAGLLPDVRTEKDFIVYGPSPVGRRSKSGVYVRVPYGEVPLRKLSYGYQTMIAWLSDIAWQLFRRYPDSAHPLGEPAIVLVDEIDLHLHPRWQREIQKLLVAHFPAVQFIATAHSPLMAQAAIGLNLAVVLRDGDTVFIDNDPSVVANWRIDQVVTSELFGLPPWSPEVQSHLEEQALLAQKSNRSPQDDRRLEMLENFARTLPTGLPPALERAVEIIQSAASAFESKKS